MAVIIKKLIFLKGIIVITVTIIISFLDIYAFKKNGIFSILANQLWIIGMVWFYCFSIWYIVKILWQDIQKRKFAGIIALLVVTLLVSFKLETFPLTISGEGAIEESTALDYMKKADWGYTKTAFLGNISRQYVMTALPSYFLGRNIVSFRIGVLLIFLFGIYLIYAGLRTYYSSNPSSVELASLSILAIMSFPVVTVILRIFDAVILPLAFTMQTLGFLLLIKGKPRFVTFLSFVWILTMLSTIYTPSLASWILITIIVLILALKELIHKRFYVSLLWFSCFVLSVVFGWNALQIRQDVRTPQPEVASLETTIEKTKESFEYFFIKNTYMYDYHPLFVGHLMFLPTITYLIGALLFVWGYKHFALALWILATIIISGISPGYAKPPVHYGIHRALVVLPFIVVGIMAIFGKYKTRFYPRFILLLITVFCIFDIYTVFSIYQTSLENFDIRAVVLRETLATAKKFSISPNDPIQLGTFTQDQKIHFFPDQLLYFFPKYKLFTDNKLCLEGFDYSIKGIFYFDKQSCSNQLSQMKNMLKIDKIDLEILYKTNTEIIKAVYIPEAMKE